MKQIIRGKLYNTETAAKLGSFGKGMGFSHYSETLYVKKTGEFFIYGEGGPRSKYAESIDDNTWSGGSRITPLASEEEARDWAEDHLDVDQYIEIFGQVEE